MLRPPLPRLTPRLLQGAMVILCCNRPDQENKYGFNSRKNHTSQEQFLNNILIDFTDIMQSYINSFTDQDNNKQIRHP